MTNNKASQLLTKLLISFDLLWLLFSLFTYVFTDPNLTLINQSWFINWQEWCWQQLLPNSTFRTGCFALLMALLSINYYLIVRTIKHNSLERFTKGQKLLLAGALVLLLLSYNALSHDVFNYMFNAKMLVKYQANPHRQVALNFAQDPWTRFMNNTHTPAPYGYLWTGLSVIPYLLGLGKFITTWLSFKFFALLGLALAIFFIGRLAETKKVKLWQLALVLFNPLILIESISSAHNDWWMMWPVLASLYYAGQVKPTRQNNYPLFLLIIILMTASINIKYASLVAIPFIIYYLFKSQLDKLKIFSKKITKNAKKIFDQYFFDLLSLSFFLPLLTNRSQRFLTWYLIWPMTFLPFVRSKWWRNTLLIFSISALLSYLPWIYYLPWLTFDQATPDLLLLKQLILWLPSSLYSLCYLAHQLSRHCKKS